MSYRTTHKSDVERHIIRYGLHRCDHKHQTILNYIAILTEAKLVIFYIKNKGEILCVHTSIADIITQKDFVLPF